MAINVVNNLKNQNRSLCKTQDFFSVVLFLALKVRTSPVRPGPPEEDVVDCQCLWPYLLRKEQMNRCAVLFLSAQPRHREVSGNKALLPT